jgi:hypothetical protein
MRADHFPRSPRLHGQAGFTLIEVLASALIVILISVAVAQGLISGAHLSGYQQHKTQADEVAQQDQERLRGLSSKQLSGLSTAQTYQATLGGTTFTVSSQATLLSTSGTSSCTTAGGSAVAYYRTVSTVTWNATSGSQSVTEDSIITPPISGELLTQVTNETGAALPGATITATGQSSGTHDQEAGTTDGSGCVIMTGLSPDTYTVAVTDPGYVDYNGNTTLSDSATVTASGTARPTTSPEVIGQAGTVTANFSTQAYSSDTSTTVTTVASQYATNLSYYGAGGAATMSSYDTASNSSTWASSFTASNLFPFYFSGPPASYTGNYRMWAGACFQEAPPTTYDSTTVSPGSVSSMTVQEPSLILTAYYNNGTSTSRIAPADAKVYFTSSTGTSCSDTWTEPIRASAASSNNGVLAYPGIPYAASTTSGSAASASGQTGSLSACVDYNTGGTTGWRRTTGTISLPLSMTAPNTLSLTVTKTGTSGTCP